MSIESTSPWHPRSVTVTIDGRTFVKKGENLYGCQRCNKCAWFGNLCFIAGELESICGDGYFEEANPKVNEPHSIPAPPLFESESMSVIQQQPFLQKETTTVKYRPRPRREKRSSRLTQSEKCNNPVQQSQCSASSNTCDETTQNERQHATDSLETFW